MLGMIRPCSTSCLRPATNLSAWWLEERLLLAIAILVANPVHRRIIAERSRTRSRARRLRRQTDALTARAIYESEPLCYEASRPFMLDGLCLTRTSALSGKARRGCR